ncbi:MAG: hypothetical protein Q9228_003724 [Teloschistes exilis]
MSQSASGSVGAEAGQQLATAGPYAALGDVFDAQPSITTSPATLAAGSDPGNDGYALGASKLAKTGEEDDELSITSPATLAAGSDPGKDGYASSASKLALLHQRP